jgi:hypothetical protein
MKPFAAVPALLVLLSAPALADDQYLTPSDPIAGHPDLTYADMLKQVIPDLADDGSSGHLPDDIRHIDPGSEGDVPDSVDIQTLYVEHIQVAGRPTLWLLTDLGGGGTLGDYSLLSVFSDEAQPKLIDTAEVDTDRFTNFSDVPLRISKVDEAMLVDSNHFNSEQNYSAQDLVFVRDGKLTVAASFLVFGVHACHMVQEERLKISSRASGKDYWPFTATITRAQARNKDDAEDCLAEDAPTKSKSFAATYKWDATRGAYRTSSKALDQLAKSNETLF